MKLRVIKLLIIFLSLFLLKGCGTKNELNGDDYDIINTMINNDFTVSFTVLKKDYSLRNLIDGTSEYSEKINNLYLTKIMRATIIFH